MDLVEDVAQRNLVDRPFLIWDRGASVFFFDLGHRHRPGSMFGKNVEGVAAPSVLRRRCLLALRRFFFGDLLQLAFDLLVAGLFFFDVLILGLFVFSLLDGEHFCTLLHVFL